MVMKKKAPVKKTAATMASPSYVGKISKGTVRAGSSKGTAMQRKMQNKAVKDGTIRLGKSGKSYNVYDAKSGTWKRGVVSSSASKPSAKSGATGTYTKSYENKGYKYNAKEGVNKTSGVPLNQIRDRKVADQRVREQKRIAARKAK